MEYDLLELRLRLLWDRVDKFVIVEGDKTFSGLDKPFNFEVSRDRFKWAESKIVYLPLHIDITGIDLTSKPDKYDPLHDCWKIEYRQRNALVEACKDFDDDDIVMMGDVDEIPSLDAIAVAKNSVKQFPLVCSQMFFYYDLTTLWKHAWDGTVFTTLGFMREHGAQNLRHARHTFSVLEGGGWHLSYQGGAAKIQEKIKSFSHKELDKPEFTELDRIQERMNRRADLFDRGGESIKVGNAFFPLYFVRAAKKVGLM